MKRRLLLDSEVIEFLERLPAGVRTSIWQRLIEIARAPDRFEDYRERDATGRDLSAHVFRGYAILFSGWLLDSSDRKGWYVEHESDGEKTASSDLRGVS